jgi:hypothetical protein
VQQQSVDPGVERHDGLMLRFTLGLGWSSAKAMSDSLSGDITFSGFSGGFSFDLGGTLTENLVLHVRFSDMPMVNPDVYLNGERAGEVQNASLTAVMFGPALTYYFMPANIYLTLALGLSWLTADTDQSDARSSDIGFGSNFDVGKEWWVSDNWGLGLAARFWYTHVNDSESSGDSTFNMLGFSLLFSATYN